ncbi:MAG: DNA translocase FtsK [Elusimicrobiota bacterium]|jgi:S-DNA-T family DNA segregation ATPase FtsK/SpoIIIE|nr:DNA translocase FtsK [Elusimicrobiota bacterium]
MSKLNTKFTKSLDKVKKLKNNTVKYKNYFYFILFFLISILFFYFIFFSSKSGIIGNFFYEKLIYIFGKCLYLLPFFLIIFSFNFLSRVKIKNILHLDNKSNKKYSIFILMGFFLILAFLATIFEIVLQNENGGIIGVFISDLLIDWIGTFGAFLVSIFFVLLGLYLLSFEIIVYLISSIENQIKFRKVISNKNDLSQNQNKFLNTDNVVETNDFLQKENFILKNNEQKDIKNDNEIDYKKESFFEKMKRFFDLLFGENDENFEKEKASLGILQQFEELKNKRSLKKLKLDKKEEKVYIEENISEKSEEFEKKTKLDKKTDDDFKYVFPNIDLLDKPQNTNNIKVSEKEINDNINVLQKTLKNFGVNARVIGVVPGPVITRYEIELAPGVKVSTIISLKNDICIAMKTQTIMIIAPIIGKSAIGLEIPNQNKEQVLFREFIESSDFKNNKMLLPFALGKTVSGKIYITDIAKTPHLLIAGSTGSGKSVCVNALIMSILYSRGPNEVKFIMIDPKVVELSYYKEIPHLYHPVITNPKEASKVLGQIVFEMEQRYQKFADEGVRNIESYNEKMKIEKREQEFYLIVIIDELADLMLVASKDVEESIVRLTQKARAVGIHVILATQRPSVDVITGIIKANLPSRISFQVISKMDSRVILDTNGAEDLLGRGDMLFLENGSSKPIRLQGAFLSEKEVSRVTKALKNQRRPDFSKFSKKIEKAENEKLDEKIGEDLKKALNVVIDRKKISYDLLRANGFSGPKATNIMSLLEIKGFINKPFGTQKWEIDFEAIEKYLS